MIRAHAVLLPLILLVARGAAAAPRDAVAAEALFRSGREALKRGEWATACAKLSESQSLDPAAGTALNLAVCEEKQGHVASAWQRLREAIDFLPQDDDRIPLALKQIALLERRLPHLTVRLAPQAPPGTRVQRDEVEMTGALIGFAEPVDPGPHVIRVSAPGYAGRMYQVDAREGFPEELAVEPGPPLPPPVMRYGARRVAGFVALGIGGSMLAVGAVTGLTVIARGNERARLCAGDACPTQSASDNAHSVDSLGKTLAIISPTAFAMAAVGVASGVYLLLSSPGKESAHVALAPVVLPGATGLTLSGAF